MDRRCGAPGGCAPVRSGRPRHAGARCAPSRRSCARPRSCGRWRRRPIVRSMQPRRVRSTELAARRLAGEPVARIVGTKEFWGLPLRLSPGNPRAAAGDRNRGRGGARRARPRRPAHAGAAYRRPRHRLGRAPAGAAVRASQRLLHRHRRERGRAYDRPRQCGAARLRRARGVCCLRFRRGAGRRLRSRRFQSALRPQRRYRGIAARGPRA